MSGVDVLVYLLSLILLFASNLGVFSFRKFLDLSEAL